MNALGWTTGYREFSFLIDSELDYEITNQPQDDFFCIDDVEDTEGEMAVDLYMGSCFTPDADFFDVEDDVDDGGEFNAIVTQYGNEDAMEVDTHIFQLHY